MFDDLISSVVRELKKAKIPYVIIGGQAVLRYGEPRLTKDVDITLGIDVDQSNQIIDISKRLKLKILVPSPASFVKKTYVLPVADKRTGVRVDFIFSNTSFEQGMMLRGKNIKIGKVFVRFASVEDVIIQKIIAGRPRDIEDVSNILIKITRMNVVYIRKWLKEFEHVLDVSLINRFNQVWKNRNHYK